MEFDNTQTQKANINKGTHTTMKYAPGKKINYEPVTTKIRRERRAFAKSQQQQHKQDVEHLRQQAMQQTTYSHKRGNTYYAQQRVEAKIAKYKEFAKRPANLAPILDLKVGDSSREQRLVAYTRKHKCPHGNAYTSVRQHDNIRLDGTKEPVYLEPVCHCSTEKCSKKYESMNCGNCTRNVLEILEDPTFPGDIRRCTFCRLQWYRIISWSRERALDIVALKEKPKVMPATTKQWAKLPDLIPMKIGEEKEESQKEFGEAVTDMIKTVLVKLKDMTLGIIDWITATLIHRALKNSIIWIWTSLRDILETMLARFVERPMIFIYHFYLLIRTESHIERMFVFWMIVSQMGLTQMVERIFSYLGFCTSSIPGWREMDLRKERRRPSSPPPPSVDGFTYVKPPMFSTMAKLSVRNAQRAAANLATLREESRKRVDPANHPDIWEDAEETVSTASREKPTIRFSATHPLRSDLTSEDTDKESGTFWLEALFQFSKWLPKTGLSLIKDFNAMMSGWKNLHELVNNLLDKLPTWLTKLFTITDPRKRYGVESKTPGTPIYEMIQAYLELLKGENCASPAQYTLFMDLWKKADIYITAEYQANEFVRRLHAGFRLNATALMKPGTRGSKPIPFVITLFGPPGSGKSSTWPVMVAKITGGTMEEIREMSYTRNPVSDYFDGYVPEKHKIFLYDDFGSQVDDESMGELMSIVSNADYLPPYASLNDPNVGVKGTSFDSPIVILCSNFKDYSHCKQIADKVALQRRLGIVINWNAKWKPGNTYEVFETLVDGTQRPIVRKDAPDNDNNRYTLPEIQQLLADLYKKHMLEQRTRDELFEALLPQGVEKGAFLAMYDAALRQKKKPTAEKQTGFFTAFAIVAFAHQLAKFTDSKLHGWGTALLGVLGAVAAGYTLARVVLGHTDTDTESGEGHQAKSGTKTPLFTRIAKHPTMKEVGESNDEGVLRKVMNNHILIVDENLRYVSGVFVSGRIFLTVKHFIRKAKKISLHTHRATDTQMFEFDVEDARILEFPDVDLILVECPTYVQPFTNIVKYFCDRAVTKDVAGYVTRRNHNIDLVVFGTTIRKSTVINVFRDDDGSTYEGVCHIQYDYTHGKGDCGNLVFASQDGSLKIVGIHESGSKTDPNKSFANTVHRVELEGLLKNFETVPSLQEEFPYEEVQLEDGKGFNKTMFVGYSDRHIVGPMQSDLRKSELFDKVREHTTVPALLCKKGDIDPMAKALNKYGLSTKQFPIHLAEHATQSLTEELKSHLAGDDFTPLTIDQALNGIPSEVDSVDLSTSSGYPFSLDPKLRGAKRLVIDGEPGELTLSTTAKIHYESWEKLIQQQQIPSDPFIATLKDEPRPIEKVALGKTRVFCAGSLTSFLMNKRYFARFGVFLKRIRGKTFSTIGLNRGSREWHEMIVRAREVGEFGLDGDQEEWDGRFKSHLALMAHRIISDVSGFNDKDRAATLILFLHAVFPHLRISWRFGTDMVTVIVRILGCMPSGWYLTLIVNSLVNALLFRMAWIALVSPPFNDLQYFRQYTREKYTGDDNFLGVATAFLEQYNNITIAEYFLAYGQKYTPASKKGELVPYQRVEDCVFLKTTTGILFDQYVPLFDMNANFSTLNWTRKSDDNFVATENNCNDVLRNLFFYGEQEFTRWRNKMLEVAPKLNLINFYSMETAYLGYGAIPDPYGTFGFTKSKTKNPAAFYRAVQQALATVNSQNSQKEISEKESGQYPHTMNLSCEINELKQLQMKVKRMSADYDTSRWRIAKTFAELNGKEITASPFASLYAEASNEKGYLKLAKELDSGLAKHSPLSCPLTDNYSEESEYKYWNGKQINGIIRETITKFNNFKRREQEFGERRLNLAMELVRKVPEKLDVFLDFMDQNQEMSFKQFEKTHAINKLMNRLEVREESEKESGRVEQPVQLASTTPATEVGAPADLDDSTPKVAVRMGVHLAEQQQTVMREGTDGASRAMASRADAHLNEMDWDLQKMLTRFNLVSAFPWALTDNVGTELAIGAAVTDVPADLLKNDISSAPFQRFVWWRCKRIKVRFQLVASRFHQGRALVYFVPSCLPKAEQTAAVRGPIRATQLQHGFLDPANGTVLDFEIPFVFHKGFLDLVFGDSLGQLHFQVLNKLQAATGASTSVEVKVFVSFEDSHFRVPREGGISFEKALLQSKAKRLGFKLIEREEAEKESGTFESIGGNLGRTAGKEVDTLINSLIPQEITGAVAGVLLDKPAVTEYPEPLVHKDAQYMSSSRGIEKLERMTLEPSAQNLTDDQFGSEQDEMDIKYLLKKPVYYTQFNWAATANVGDVLFQTPVSPAHLINPLAEASLPGATFDATILGFLANMFTLWRGSIVFIFQFIGTAFHEGRIDFCNHVGQLTPPADYATAMSQYVNSQTIRNTNNTVEVRVPFHSDTPWKRVWNGEPLGETPSVTTVRALDYITGCFTVRVSVPLKNPNNVANNIDVNVFVLAGDDFEFHQLTLYGMRFAVASAAVRDERREAKRRALHEAVKESGDLNTDDKTDNGVAELGAGQAYTRDLRMSHFGETYTNLREMCKRYTHIEKYQFTVSDIENYANEIVFNPRYFPGMLGVLFNSYRLFRGPMNWKLKVLYQRTATDADTVGRLTGYVTTLYQPPFDDTAIPAGGTPLTYRPYLATGYNDNRQPALVRFSDQQVAEYQVPFQSIYHSLLTFLAEDTVSPYYRNALVQFNQVVGLDFGSHTVAIDKIVTLFWDASFADETRLGLFMGFPQLARRSGRLWPNTHR